MYTVLGNRNENSNCAQTKLYACRSQGKLYLGIQGHTSV